MCSGVLQCSVASKQVLIRGLWHPHPLPPSTWRPGPHISWDGRGVGEKLVFPKNKYVRADSQTLLCIFFKDDFFIWNFFFWSLLNLLLYCLCFGFFGPKACGILGPRPGIEPAPSALKGGLLTLECQGKSLLGILIACVCLGAQCPALCDPMDCSPPGFSVMGILQARILEWVVMPSSRASSQSRDRTQFSHVVGGFFTIWATRNNDLRILLTCKLLFGRTGLRPEILYSSKFLGDASAAADGLGTTIWVAGPRGSLYPLLGDCLMDPDPSQTVLFPNQNNEAIDGTPGEYHTSPGALTFTISFHSHSKPVKDCYSF